MNSYKDTVTNRKPEVQLSSATFIEMPSNSSKTLLMVAELFEALNGQEIRYCHWKSNSRLQWGLEGRTDLDLLVDPNHKRLFKNLLADHGIKPILPPAGKQYPDMEHYLGFDSNSGGLFHLHVHYELVLGEQFVKNYSLPLGKHFIDSATLLDGVMVPAPELELIVLSLRALLKYRDRDVVKDVLDIRSPGIPEHILNEIYWLLSCSSLEKVAQVLKSLPELGNPEIILEFLQIINKSPRDGRKLLLLRRGIRKMLRPYQRQSRLLASFDYLKLSARKVLIQRSNPDRQMSLPNGGLMIAMVGVDGAGKSTLCVALNKWLSWKVDVLFFYLGSKQPSIWTDWSYLLFRIARRGHREVSALLGENNFLPKWILSVRQVLLALHYLSVGWDRDRRYQMAKELIKEGSVVIFDRFPLEAPLDGPQVHLIDNGNLNSVSKFLSHKEKNIYKRFDHLDLFVLLNISLETSLQRKPDHPREVIQEKNKVLSEIKANLAEEPNKWNWVSIDAELPFEDVLLDIKRSVWAAL